MTSLIRPPFSTADRMISVRPDSRWAAAMTRLERLYTEQRQSPWLDNLTRPYLRDGTLAAFVADGIRGVTANPTILARAIEGSDAYDDAVRPTHRRRAIRSGMPTGNWPSQDVTDALAVLRPTFDNSHGSDGFVSIEVAPELARDTEATIAAAARLHERIARPNLLVKIPATAEGIPAIASVDRSGVEHQHHADFLAVPLRAGDRGLPEAWKPLPNAAAFSPAVRSVASFFVSRVDTEVDQRLEQIGGEDALALRGRAAVAQARLAYQIFRNRFAGERWEKLAARGARVQPPLWASTSTKNPDYPDTLYVDSLIGPDTINTMAEATITAFEDHGTLARTVDTGIEQAETSHARLNDSGGRHG